MAYKNPADAAAWREAHTEAHRDYIYRRDYGITTAEYNRMVALQCATCAICGAVPCEDPDAGRNQKRLHVDHDHITGEVRGLLCSDCNRGIGFLGESAENLSRAASYLTGRG